MKFEEALKHMKKGTPMKLPSWGGYWLWDNEKQTILMHCREKDSDTGKEVIDIRETQRVEYTLSNVCSDEWEEATKENCTLLGGTPTFDFKKALDYILRGIEVKRKDSNVSVFILGDSIVCSVKEKETTTVYTNGYVFTLSDLESKDWTFAE